MDEDAAREFTLNLTYRMAYGWTCRRLEWHSFDKLHRRLPREDALAELRVDPADGEAVEAARRGIEDAEAG